MSFLLILLFISTVVLHGENAEGIVDGMPINFVYSDGGSHVAVVVSGNEVGGAREYIALPGGPSLEEQMANDHNPWPRWTWVEVDGVKGKEYYGIGENTPVFSKDGRRIAYIAKYDGCVVMVVDGHEGLPFKSLSPPVFSDNSQRVAYRAAVVQDAWVIVVDGIGGLQPYNQIGNPVFSPDGKRLAYWGSKDGKYRMIVDGVESEAYDNIEPPIFSPDGKRLAYWVKKDGKYNMIVDGVTMPAYDDIGKPVFSPDGKRLTYLGIQDGKHHTIVDGVDGPAYEAVGISVFSSDNKRLAYWGKKDGKYHMIVDGVDMPAYDDIGTPVFSSDSKRLAYWGKKDGKYHMIVDGVDMPAYDDIGTPIFSPDGKRLTYLGIQDGKHHMIVDGVDGPAYEAVGLSVFSSDGKRLAYWGKKDGKYYMIVDGVEGKAYDNIATPVFSPDGKRLAYWGKKDDKYHMIVDGVDMPAYDNIGNPVFSPDSQRLAYWGERNDKYNLIVDGVEGLEFTDPRVVIRRENALSWRSNGGLDFILARAEQNKGGTAALSELTPDAAFRLGYIYAEQKDYVNAIKYYQSLQPTYRLADKATYAIAWAYRDQAMDKEANEQFEKVAKVFPKSPLACDSLYRIGVYWQMKKQYTDAIPYFARALDLNPMDTLTPVLFYNMGLCFFNTTQYQEAANAFDKVTANDSTREYVTESFFWKGQSAEKLGQFTSARDSYQAYLTTYPKGNLALDAALGSGRTALLAKQYATAHTDLLKALSLCDEVGQYTNNVMKDRAKNVEPEAQFYLAQGAYEEKAYADALKAYTAVLAYRYEPWYSHALLQMAQCSGQLGDKPAVEQFLRRLLNDTPNSEAAKNAPEMAKAYGVTLKP